MVRRAFGGDGSTEGEIRARLGRDWGEIGTRGAGRRGGDDKGGVPALLPSRDDDDDEQEEGDREEGDQEEEGQEEGEQEDEDEEEGGRGGGRMGGGRRMGASGVKHSQSTNRDTARAPPRPSRPVAERSTSTTGLPTAPRLPARDPGRRGRTARALAMDD